VKVTGTLKYERVVDGVPHISIVDLREERLHALLGGLRPVDAHRPAPAAIGRAQIHGHVEEGLLVRRR
jgi:hypothetical protein